MKTVFLLMILLLIVFALATVAVSLVFIKKILTPHVGEDMENGARDFEKTMQTARITSFDGLKLTARYRLREEQGHDWVISIHGYTSSHEFMLPYGAAFYEKGYHVLLPDDRGHGESEGRYIGMGWLDKEDIAGWIRWIVNRDEQARIILHGISMGGATVMMTAGENHDHVAGYIEDCGYTSVWDIFACVMKRDYHLPAFPILHCSRLLFRKMAGYDFVEASSIDQLKKSTRPILFIHGEKDGFVPVSMGRQAYEAYNGEKELYIAKNAGHARSMNADAELYFQKIFEFIDTRIKK